MKAWVAIAAVVGFAGAARAEIISGESERSHVVEFKLGSYTPMIDAEFGDAEGPYATFFGGKPMLMFQLEAERMFWKDLGSLSAGLSVGYAEKYAAATAAETGERTQESSSLRVVPLRAIASYRFDYGALKYSIPLVPYVKVGLGYTLWSSTDASGAAVDSGSDAVASEAKGGKWGYTGILGVAFMLDVLEPRLAKDADSDLGINHFYFFGEYIYENYDDFGRGGLNLSSRRWMFGLALEF